ncbi:MAG: aminotransferase class III-fold pyridoxal phosphate-dependent enzyme, partial [Planctomycetota bacterium]|nr:aminotransferase class III-fold pyridoxal phosphate-dependent enzyme [Planctomycetota bacterium]
EGLHRLEERHEIVGDVRGRGLFLGFELVRDRTTLEPADAEATALVNAMRERGVLLSTDGPLHNVIKIKPPLVVDEGDVDMTLRLLDDVLAGLG